MLQLSPKQSEIALDTHRFRVINAGRRFGKTFLAVWEMLGKAVFHNDRKICYIAPTYGMARDIAWQELKKVCEPVTITANETKLEITIRTQDGGQSKISLRGWESVETLRGQAFDFMIIDEVAMMKNFKEQWSNVIRPTLIDRTGEVMFISTPRGFNHFYDLYNEEKKDKDYKSFHCTSFDNPHLPQDELRKAKLELTEDRYAQEILADFRKTEGLVYKEFDRNRHLFDSEVTRVAETIGGLDFGFTNPCAALTIKRDYDDNYWVTNEWYERGRTDEQIADYVANLGWNKCYADPEAPAAIQVLKNKGVNVQDVIKGKDSIVNGINRIRELFKQNRLHIHKSCEDLIYELETYCYPDKTANHNEPEMPIKENDHACDALRYALAMNKPEERLTQIELIQRFNARRNSQNNQAR